MKKTSFKPVAAGMLDINAGIISIIAATSLIWVVLSLPDQNLQGLVIAGSIVILAGLFMLAGGWFAFNRQHFRLAVAGSACAIIVVIGIPALILVILSRSEFG
jgi:hypothetical protein